MIWLFGLSLAAAEPVEVVRDLGGDMRVNWSRMVVEVTTADVQRGTATIRATEESARRQAEVGIRSAAERVRVTDHLSLLQLLDGEDQNQVRALQVRMGRWTVSETRYHASGRVEVVGELSLLGVLKPWTVSRIHEPMATEATTYTGVIVDARGLGAEPCFAPRLVSEDGTVLSASKVYEHVAVERTPAVWVADGAHPAAQRAGDEPMYVTASRATGCDLEVDGAGRRSVEAAVASGLLAEARLVIVVEP